MRGEKEGDRTGLTHIFSLLHCSSVHVWEPQARVGPIYLLGLGVSHFMATVPCLIYSVLLGVANMTQKRVQSVPKMS